MKTSTGLTLLLILLIGVMVACGPSEQELGATQTAETLSLSGTQTAEAPTETPVVATPTARPTLTPSPTPSPVPSRPSAEALIDAAWLALDQAESYHQVLEQSQTISFPGVEMTASFLSDLVAQPPDRARFVSKTTGMGGTVLLEAVFIGDTTYTRDSAEGEWTQSAGSLSDAELETLTAAVRDVEQLTLVGEEVLDGLPVYHLQGKITEVEALADTPLIWGLLAELGGSGADIEFDVDYDVDYWIDRETGRLVKTTTAGLMGLVVSDPSGSEESVEIKLAAEETTLYSDYDAPVEIEPPETGPKALTQPEIDALLPQFLEDAPTVRLEADGSGDFPDLQAAVNSVEGGAILMLGPGTYHLEEPLEIDKSIGLIGSGMEETEIVSEAEGYAIRYEGEGLFGLQNLTVRHEGSAPADVVVVERGELAFALCRFSGATTVPEDDEWHAGLLVKGNTNGTVIGCEARDNNGDGVWISDDASLQLVRNECSDNSGDGVYIDGRAQPKLVENRCSGNESSGISVLGTAEPSIERNTCVDNVISGIDFSENAGGVARENDCSRNQEGIAVSGEARPMLQGNTCNDNTFAGIVFRDFSAGQAVENECSRNDVGIEVSGSARPTLSDNVCTNNHVGIKILEGEGIALEGAAEPTLEGNDCRGNEESGIKYLDATGGIARNNVCSENGGPGIFVAEGAQPTLVQNVCRNNGTSGIHYADNAGGTAEENNVSNNAHFGIEVGGDAEPILERNTCDSNEFAGIGFFDNSGGVARSNECSQNSVGIFVYNSARPSLEGNLVTDNVVDGIGYGGESGGLASQNVCTGNENGIHLMETAEPELVDNDCHDNTANDFLDERD